MVVSQLKKFDYLLTLDEQTYSGGLFSILSERVDHKKILNFSIPDKFIFENNGRELLLDQNGLSVKNIYNKLNNICN